MQAAKVSSLLDFLEEPEKLSDTNKAKKVENLCSGSDPCSTAASSACHAVHLCSGVL